MFKTPRRLFNQRNPDAYNGKGGRISVELNGILEDEIPFTIEEISWVTNVVEPEQQRGPSEYA